MLAADVIADGGIQNARIGASPAAETAHAHGGERSRLQTRLEAECPRAGTGGGIDFGRTPSNVPNVPYLTHSRCTYWASMLAARRPCACLPTTSGRVLAESHGGGANLQASGELEVEKVLHQVMEETLGSRDIRPDAICLGIAGVDRPSDATAVRGIMRRIGFKTRVVVVNDALVALVAGAGEQPGVVIVAGTGSIAYGVDANPARLPAGGWGYLLGDEGGGFWIGRAASVGCRSASSMVGDPRRA